MTTKSKNGKKLLSEEEIDNLVESEADDDAAWDEPILVSGKRQASLSLPADLASRAAFLAMLHKVEDTKERLRRILAERIELEESACLNFKKELASNRRA